MAMYAFNEVMTAITGPSFLRGTLALGAYGNINNICVNGWTQGHPEIPTHIESYPNTHISSFALTFSDETTFIDYLFNAGVCGIPVKTIVTDFIPENDQMYKIKLDTDMESIHPEFINLDHQFTITNVINGTLMECFTDNIISPVVGYIITPNSDSSLFLDIN